MECFRYDKTHVGLFHFEQLIARDARLQGKDVFALNPGCFIEHLPPTIFAGGFHSKSYDAVFRILGVFVCGGTRYQKIRFAIDIGLGVEGNGRFQGPEGQRKLAGGETTG